MRYGYVRPIATRFLLTLQSLDTAGQEEYRVLQDQYILRGEGFMILYSITSHQSFELVTNIYQKINLVKEDDDHFPVVSRNSSSQSQAILQLIGSLLGCCWI